MTIIHHPTRPVTREVPDERAEAWLAAGWLLTDAEEAQGVDAFDFDDNQDSTAAAIATDQGQHSDEGDEA